MTWPLEATLLHAAWFVVGVLLPGGALVALLPPAPEEEAGPKAFLRLAAAGILWNALELGAVLLVRPPGPLPPTAVLSGALAADLALVVAALLWRRCRLAGLIEAAIRGVSPILLALAIVCGLAAVRAFPHVIDCVQLRWTEDLLAGRPPSGNSGALAFSAWMLFPGLSRGDLPLVSSAAGARLPLLLLAFLAGHALVRAAGVRRVAFGTGLYLLVLLASYFGRFGLVELGKDSLFGLVFAVAFASALPRARPGEGRRDRGLFLAASVLLGVISFPFLAVLAVLDLAFRLPKGGLKGDLRTLALFGVPASLPALLSMSRVSPTGLAVVLAVTVAGLFAFPDRPIGLRRSMTEPVSRLLPFFVFLSLVGLGALLMPVYLPMTVEYDAADRPVFEARFPLDGTTSFAAYLLGSGGQRYTPVAAAGLLGVLFYLARRPSRRDSSLVALALAPLFQSLAGLLFARLPTPPLPPFHVWDLVRDVPLWLGGPVWGLFAVLAADDAVDRLFGERFSDRLLAGALAAAVTVGVILKRSTLPQTLRPAVLTPAAGHQDPDVAALFQEVWSHRTDARTIVVPDSSFARHRFFHFGDFTRAVCVRASLSDPDSLRLALARRPALVVADSETERQLAGLLREESQAIRLVRRFDAKGESLFRIAERTGR